MTQRLANSITVASNAGAGDGAAVWWPGGIGTFKAAASWGGGSAKLQVLLPDGATWDDLADIVLDASTTSIGFELDAAQIRCVVATATGVYATVGLVSQ